MTDERMDARLRAAGEAWRATTGSVAADLAVPPAQAHRRRRGALLASAAAVVAALVAAGAYALSGLSSDHRASTDTAGLQGTVWRLVGYGNQRDKNSDATFYIDKDGALVADDACSVIGAHATADGSRLDVTKIGIRYRSCTDTVGETTFSRALPVLRSDPRYVIDGNELTISTPGRSAMHFVAAPNLVPPTLDVPTLQGATWRLTVATDPRGLEVHAPNSTTTLTIDGNHFATSDGCNTISGSVHVAGSDLRIDEYLPSGDVGCATASLVGPLFNRGTSSWAISGTTLTVSRPGVGSARYTWVPKDKDAVDPKRFVDNGNYGTWYLASIAGTPVRGYPHLYIGAAVGGSMSFQDGCGEWNGGGVRVDAGVLRLSGARTKPLHDCTGTAGDLATTVDSIFTSNPVMWAIRDGKLLIYGGGSQAFSLVYVAHKNPLVGPVWKLAGSTVSLYFPSTGRGRLAVTCEQDDAAVSISAHQISFERWSRMPHSCPAVRSTGDPISELARARSELTGSVSWSIKGGTLTLTKGGTTLTFER